MKKDNRGQVQTIEAFIGTFILLAVLAVVVQATSVTPLTTSFTNQHIKYELQNLGQDILTSLDETPYLPPAITVDNTPSKLEKSIRDWLAGAYVVPDGSLAAAPNDWYTYDGVNYFISPITTSYHQPQTDLEKALTFAFSRNGIAYNVEVRYPEPDQSGGVKVYSAKMIWNGDPSDNCVTVSRYLSLHDPLDPAQPGAADIPATATFIPDMSPGTVLHSVVEVRLTLWVM